MKQEADAAGYETFLLFQTVLGSLFSLALPGLLPIAASGADIDQLMMGADAMDTYTDTILTITKLINSGLPEHFVPRKGFTTEFSITNLICSTSQALFEWWKQLMGEFIHKGKSEKSILHLPTSQLICIH